MASRSYLEWSGCRAQNKFIDQDFSEPPVGIPRPSSRILSPVKQMYFSERLYQQDGFTYSFLQL